MAKFHVNDVRASSADVHYQGVAFSGSLKQAAKQAKKAPDYGVPQLPKAYYAMSKVSRGKIGRDRFNLLQFLNLTKPTAIGFDR
jgi:hypothetical protein